MKTQVNINLKKMALTAFAALAIAAGSFEQPRNANFNSEALASLTNLEALMVLTEQNIKYVAPAAEENLVNADALLRLQELALATEAALTYEAPSADAADAQERLELLAGATEAILQYCAPEVNDNEFNQEYMTADLGK